jgi:hypothetical protein
MKYDEPLVERSEQEIVSACGNDAFGAVVWGLTLAEMVQLYGAPDPSTSTPPTLDGSTTRTWSRPGGTIRLRFGPDGRATEIPAGSDASNGG